MTMLSDTDWLGCGNAEHPEDCLCDVVIKKPTKWANDCVGEVHMGPQICEIRGYSIPWTREQLVNYLDDLRLYQDTLHGSVLMDETPTALPTDKSIASMQKVRQAVAKHMAQENANILEVLNLLGISGQIFMRAMTTNQLPELKLKKWNAYLLAQFQQDLEENKLGYRELMRKYDLTKNSLYNLKGYFTRIMQQHSTGLLVSVAPENKARARVVAKKLIDQGCNNKEIVDQVFKETQIYYTTSAISKLRSRNSDLES